VLRNTSNKQALIIGVGERGALVQLRYFCHQVYPMEMRPE
jgi:hypothetical protein